MIQVVKVLQQHDYDHWENVAVIPDKEIDNIEYLRPMAVEAATLDKYYNTTAKKFSLIRNQTGSSFFHFQLNYLMKYSVGAIGDYSRCVILFRIVSVDANSESVKVGDTPVVWPPYGETNTDITMDKWINNQALDPDNHLARCLACVCRDRFGSVNQNSRDAFGLYATDHDSVHSDWLRTAKLFLEHYPRKQAIDIVNFYVEDQERYQIFKQMFGDFNRR